MSNPAQYVIVQGSGTEVFYSHWGAVELTRDIFWGPERTEAFIRSHDRAEALHEDVEGTVVLDVGKRRLTWFDGNEVHEPGDEPDEQDAYVPLLDAAWSRDGWRVSRGRDVGDLAAAAGLSLLAEEREPPGTTVARFERQGIFATLLTVVDRGVPTDWVIPADDDRRQSALLHVARLARERAGLVPLDEALAYQRDNDVPRLQRLEQQLRSGAQVDLDAKRIAIHGRILPSLLADVRHRAMGFQVELHRGGWTQHFAGSGRAVAPFLARPPRREVDVLDALDRHFSAVVSRLTRTTSFGQHARRWIAEDGGTPFGGATTAAPPPLEPDLTRITTALRDVAPNAAERLRTIAWLERRLEGIERREPTPDDLDACAAAIAAATRFDRPTLGLRGRALEATVAWRLALRSRSADAGVALAGLWAEYGSHPRVTVGLRDAVFRGLLSAGEAAREGGADRLARARYDAIRNAALSIARALDARLEETLHVAEVESRLPQPAR